MCGNVQNIDTSIITFSIFIVFRYKEVFLYNTTIPTSGLEQYITISSILFYFLFVIYVILMYLIFLRNIVRNNKN